MTNPASDRVLGLTPRARKFVLPVIALAIAVVIVGQIKGRDGGSSGDASMARVGGDLHAVAEIGSETFVGGHGGAGRTTSAGAWEQIDSLDDRDVMGWGKTSVALLAGGHAGLYVSTDDGASFSTSNKAPASDVHGLGASGSIVYLASPGGGLYVSSDAGSTWDLRSDAGRAFMGSIWVDPKNPDVAIAPSMQAGAVKTTDGGRTWTALGGPMGAMSVAVDATGQKIVVVGMGEAEQSSDGGATWSGLDVPEGTSAAAYTSDGTLVSAALSGDRAEVTQLVDGKWVALD